MFDQCPNGSLHHDWQQDFTGSCGWVAAGMGAFSEAIGGLLLNMGLLTRPAAFLVCCTMLVAMGFLWAALPPVINTCLLANSIGQGCRIGERAAGLVVAVHPRKG